MYYSFDEKNYTLYEDEFEYAFYHLTDDLKVLCDFKEAEGLETCDEVLKTIAKLDSDDDDFVQSLISAVENIKSLVEERK